VLERERAAEYLESVTQRWAAHGYAAEVLALPMGPPAEAILACARGIRADLIIMTTRGRGGLARLLLGSVADAVVRHARCPVLLVPADARHSEEHDPRYRQLLVAVDGSPEAERALPHALALAQRFDAEVTLVRAVVPAVALGTGRGPGPYPRALVADERLGAAMYLAGIAQRFRRRGLHVCPEPFEGPAAEVLARRARALPADLVVLSAPRERGWLEHLTPGMTNGVLRRAWCPVLLVPGAPGPRRSPRRLETVAKR
jgi:nucleotide-binding universal stress UspA family protein